MVDTPGLAGISAQLALTLQAIFVCVFELMFGVAFVVFGLIISAKK
ncbi:MAG: hypothetical protein ACXWTR_06970 [Methylotenera sp.]